MKRYKIGYSLSIKAKDVVTYIPGSMPKVDKKQEELYKGAQTSGAGLGAEGEEGEQALAEAAGSPEQSTEKDSSASSLLGISKLRSNPGKALASLLWKASHPEAH